jgi:hypothetical protein
LIVVDALEPEQEQEVQKPKGAKGPKVASSSVKAKAKTRGGVQPAAAASHSLPSTPATSTLPECAQNRTWHAMFYPTLYARFSVSTAPFTLEDAHTPKDIHAYQEVFDIVYPLSDYRMHPKCAASTQASTYTRLHKTCVFCLPFYRPRAVLMRHEVTLAGGPSRCSKDTSIRSTIRITGPPLSADTYRTHFICMGRYCGVIRPALMSLCPSTNQRLRLSTPYVSINF